MNFTLFTVLDFIKYDILYLRLSRNPKKEVLELTPRSQSPDRGFEGAVQGYFLKTLDNRTFEYIIFYDFFLFSLFFDFLDFSDFFDFSDFLVFHFSSFLFFEFS